MIKIIFTCVLFGFLLSGCGPKKSLIVDSENKFNNEIIVIDSVCGPSCVNLVRRVIPENKDNYKIGLALVLSVNNKFGDVTFYDNRGGFNSTWNGEFEIITSSGKKNVLVKPNYWKAHPMMERNIEFSTEAGNKYFLGHLLVTTKHPLITVKDRINYSYAWTPIVVDKTKNRVVFPVEEPKWQGESIQGSSPIYIPVIK